MSELPRSWYWGPAKVTDEPFYWAAVDEEEEWPEDKSRIVVKRTWRRLWRRKRIRQEWRKVDDGTLLTGGIWDWVDAEILPDLPEAVVHE
jgi:hypothetical protein